MENLGKKSVDQPDVRSADSFGSGTIISTSIENGEVRGIASFCVNDGSTDHSLDILNSYAAQDNRFKIFNKKNSGPGDTRNLGLQHAKGTYLWFVDADDECAPNACEEIYNKMSQNNLDIFIFCANVYNEKDQKEIPAYQDNYRDEYARVFVYQPSKSTRRGRLLV